MSSSLPWSITRTLSQKIGYIIHSSSDGVCYTTSLDLKKARQRSDQTIYSHSAFVQVLLDTGRPINLDILLIIPLLIFIETHF